MDSVLLRHVVLALALVAQAAPAPASPLQTPRLGADALTWSELPELPDPIGFGGSFAGVSNGALIVAGGANFPSAPPWEGGAKVWSDEVFVLEDPDAEWLRAGRLEAPRAYGASVTTEGGLLCIGGGDADTTTDRVLRLRWANGALEVDALRPLPRPTSFCAAALAGDVLFVAPGQESADPADLIQELWSLDLGAGPEATWRSLPPCPGGPRIKAVLAAQGTGAREELFLFSGELPVRDGQGELLLTYLGDAWRFDPVSETWRDLRGPPVPIAAGSALSWGQSHVLCFSGSTGEHVGEPPETQPGFPRTISAYHTITDTWVEAGDLPEGVVTTNAVLWDGDVVIPTGEVRPGVRTRAVRRGRTSVGAASLGTLDGVLLVAYLLAVVAMGAWFSRRERTTEDYFLAGHRIPWWAAGLSIYATQLSAITFLATPALAYATDWAYWPATICILAMAPLVVRYYLPFFRRLNVTTAYEYLERRFGLAVRMYGSLSFVLFQLARMAIVVFLPSLALSTVTGFDVRLCIALIGVLATVYTVLGGMEAVIWTDVLQTFVLWGGMGLALVMAASGAGGFGEAWSLIVAEGKTSVWRGGFSFTELATWSIVLGSMFLQFGPYTTDQATVQRYMTTKDERSAARGILLNGLISVPIGLLFFLLGSFLFAFYRAHPAELVVGMKHDQVFPLFVATQLPAGLAGLVIAGVFAASMSTVDSSMHAIATSLTTDFLRRLKRGVTDAGALRFARVVIVLSGAAATGAAWLLSRYDVRSLFSFFQEVLGLLGSGLAGVFFIGLFLPRIGSRAALTGAAASSALLAWVTWSTPIHFFLYSVIGFVACVAGAWVTSSMLPERAGDLRGLTWRTREAAESEASS